MPYPKPILSLLLLALVVPVSAQGGGQPIDEGRLRVMREVIAKRDQMREGKVVRTNVRVNVRLKNGNRIVGIVKGEQFVERLDGLDFVPTKVLTSDAGIRIWTFNSGSSYIFIPYAEIQDYRISNRLTDVQLRELEEKIAAEARRNEELRRQYLARRQQQRTEQDKADKEEKEEEVEAGKQEKVDKEAARQSAQQALLKWVEDFPPEQGWSEQRLSEIETRRVVVGVAPSPQEMRFVENFALWQQAVELKKRLEAEKTAKKESEASGKDGKDPQSGGTPARPGR